MADVNAWTIIVPGAIAVVSALVTPGVVAWFAGFQRREQRLQASADELRVVIDDAARVIASAFWKIRSVRPEWQTGEDHEPDATEAWLAVRELDYMTDRLTIRVGDEHAVTEAFRSTDVALRRYWVLTREHLNDAAARVSGIGVAQ